MNLASHAGGRCTLRQGSHSSSKSVQHRHVVRTSSMLRLRNSLFSVSVPSDGQVPILACSRRHHDGGCVSGAALHRRRTLVFSGFSALFQSLTRGAMAHFMLSSDEEDVEHPSAHVLDRGMLVDGGDIGVFGSLYNVMETLFNVGLLASPVVALIYVAVNVIFSGDASRRGDIIQRKNPKISPRNLTRMSPLEQREILRSDWLGRDDGDDDLI